MNLDLIPIEVLPAPNVKCTVDTEEKRDEVDMEIDTNIVYFHLTDHDYTNMKPKTRPKKKKRPVKITKLRAIYNCTACGYRTMERDVLQKHMCTKTTKCNDITTEMLPKLSYSKKLDVTHTKTFCTDCTSPRSKVTVEYQCSQCSYTTKNLPGLKVHMHRHSQGMLYKCTECLHAAPDLKSLVKHYEDMKDLSCFCGYATHFKQHMKKHSRLHTGEKPFSCGICNFSWSDRAGLHRHMNKKHVLQ